MMLRLSLLLLATTSPALAAPQTPATQALDHLDQVAPPPAGIDVSIQRATHWDAGHFVKVSQHAWGMPVAQATLTVQLDKKLGLKRIIGTHLQEPGARPALGITADQAVASAQHATKVMVGEGEAWWPARAELGAWADTDGKVHLVWEVANSRVAPHGTYQTRVDATTGDVLSWTPTLHHAQGEVYPTNPDTSDLETVDLLNLSSDTQLDGRHVSVLSCTSFAGQTCSATTRYTTADGNGDFFYSPDPGALEDPFAEVQMYYHVDKVGQYFEDSYGFSHPEPIEAIVNFEFQNAFFGDADGDGVGEIAFGQFGQTDFAYDGDVVYHEFVHSVFSSVAGAGFFGADEYGIDFSPSALNEGTADLFSMVLSPDPKLGEYAGKGFGLGGPIRDLEEDRRCPHNLYGQQHTDGTIWASMGWNLIEDERVGADVAGQLTYGFLEQLPRTVSWGIVGDVLAQSADDLLAEGAIDQVTRDAIDEHIEAAGLVACERVIPLDDGFEPKLFVAYVPFGAGEPIPATAQFKIDVPENATDLQFQVTGFQSSDTNMRWVVYARRGAFIRHDVTNVGGFVDVPNAADFDARFDQDDIGTDGTIRYSLQGDNVLEPGETYYFSIAGFSEGGGFGISSAEATVQARVTLGDPVDDPNDPDPGVDEPVGCSCDAAAPTGLAWMALLPLGLALVRRRR